MDPLSFLKSIIKSEQPTQLEPLKLKQGQIINGKVLRFLPNDMALVQIGSQKLMAKLKHHLLQINNIGLRSNQRLGRFI